MNGWDFGQPKLDDATPQTVKLSRTVEGGIKQIDFLGAIAGLDTTAVQRRAVVITLASGVELRALHPLDVLESRLQNLLLIPKKRHAAGIAQAHLAVRIANAFLAGRIEEGASAREVLDAIERIYCPLSLLRRLITLNFERSDGLKSPKLCRNCDESTNSNVHVDGRSRAHEKMNRSRLGRCGGARSGAAVGDRGGACQCSSGDLSAGGRSGGDATRVVER